MKEKFNPKGNYHFVHKDKNGKVLDEWDVENLITDQGMNYLLGAALNNETSVANWYFAVFTTGTAATGQTYAVPSRTETANYDEANRQEWPAGTPAARSITGTAAATITASTGGITVAGVGIVGSPTGAVGDDVKDDQACTDGVLLSSADGSKTLAEGETLDMTYTVNG